MDKLKEYINNNDNCEFRKYHDKIITSLGDLKTDIDLLELSKSKPGQIVLIKKNGKRRQFFKPEDVSISRIPKEEEFWRALSPLVQAYISAMQNNYLISGKDYGFYNQSNNLEWDMSSIYKENKLLLKNSLPLVKKIKDNDRLFFRIYGKGIYGSSIVDKISNFEESGLSSEYRNSTIFSFKKTQGFANIIPQQDFFYISSLKDKRSRVLRLNDNDVSYLLNKNQKNEENLINGINKKNISNPVYIF